MSQRSQSDHRPGVPPPQGNQTRAALTRLGVDRMVLSIHQASFPAGDDDLGHGTPYSRAGATLMDDAAALGFTGLALGPAGITSRDNPSPYDATALSRNPLHLALGDLAAAGLVDDAALARAVAARAGARDRVDYAAAWAAQHALLADAAVRAARDPALPARLAAFRARAPWLADEARFEAIAAALGHDDWRRWPDDPAGLAGDRAAADRFELQQLWLAEQHARARAHARARGLRQYADLAIGLSHRDRYLRRALFLPGYAMGAPPSRTNPEGQPWGYPVLDPARLDDGAVRAFLAARVDGVLADHDGVRLDHPHGWVCPWVYRTDDPDPAAAVRAGARLHESPDLADHPALAAYALVRPDQLDRDRPRHDDAWVRALEPAQIDRYAAGFDLVVARARAHGVAPADLMIEVLSTCPRPLAAMLARHQLGRFRVTQKARVDDPTDVYRGDQAAPADWIMVGNHDTPPLALVIDRWAGGAELERRARYLAGRLAAADPGPLAARLATDRQALAEAMLAELFLGPARHVQIFWVDLLGGRATYNQPGVIDAGNWSLRAPAGFAAAHHAAVARGDAPSIDRALALALAARGLDRDDDGRALAASLRR